MKGPPETIDQTKMAAVAIARPKKKARSDQVEPLNDEESEASLPSTSQKTSRPGSGNAALDFHVFFVSVSYI